MLCRTLLYTIDKKLVNIIKTMYNNTTSCIRIKIYLFTYKMHFTWFSRRDGFSPTSSPNPALAATRLWAGYGELVGEDSISPGKPCEMHLICKQIWGEESIFCVSNVILYMYIRRVGLCVRDSAKAASHICTYLVPIKYVR